MKNFVTRALACVTGLVAASCAYAAPVPSEGHYEWRMSMQQRPGSRAPLLAPERMWVTMSAMMSRGDDCTGMMADAGTDTASCMTRQDS